MLWNCEIQGAQHDLFEKSEPSRDVTKCWTRVFNCYLRAFPHEILPVDAVWSLWSCIYQEFKDIFEENKQGFDGKSWTLTNFIAFEEHKSLLSLPCWGRCTVCSSRHLHDENRSQLTKSVNIFYRGWIKHVCLSWIKHDTPPRGGVALKP